MEWTHLETDTKSHMCNCIGPQPGQKYCPCMLRGKHEEEKLLRERLIKEGWTPPGQSNKSYHEEQITEMCNTYDW